PSHLRWGFDDVPLSLHTPSGLSLAKAKMKSTDRFLERVSTSELMKCKNKHTLPDYMLYLLIGCDISSFARSGYVNVACWIWIAYNAI
ncbi:hypothetical protein, partial [Acinetobacter baumannii]|uniref:hypothetical protein n=1 Tax=Acinetobacter baumannii TaxID=470 RepID=UPI001FF6A0B7